MNIIVTKKFLEDKTPKVKHFTTPKWVEFCLYFIDCPGITISYYEAKKTASKYIILHKNNQQFKVRFSNHKPIKLREKRGDCDFFVGVNNLSVSTTIDAIKATERWINSI